MKKRLLPLLCALLLGVSSAALCEEAAPAGAITDTAPSVVLQASVRCNIRRAPLKSAKIAVTVKRGEKLEILETVVDEDGVSWSRVRVVRSGKEGFLLSELTEPLPTPTPEPTATPVPTPTPEPTPDPEAETVYEEVRVARLSSSANLRRKPGGKLIRELRRHSLITVTGEAVKDDQLWLHVTSEDEHLTGWLLAEYTHQILPADLTEVSEADARAHYPQLSEDPIAEVRAELPFDYTDDELKAYRTIRVGDRSDSVLKLKRQLYARGYFSKPNENRQYTASTAEVVEKFQRDCGLEPTGEADPRTQAMLFDPRTPARIGSKAEVKYRTRDESVLPIRKADVGMHNYHGAVQVSFVNNTGRRITRFGIRVIPFMSDGTPAGMASSFGEEIAKENILRGLKLDDGESYSDFVSYRVYHESIDDYEFFDEHYFEIAKDIYFGGALIAIDYYRADRKHHYLDDDQLVYVSAGHGTDDWQMNVLPITVSAEEAANSAWDPGFTTHYVNPVYQKIYNLPQGAYVSEVKPLSPAYDAGLEAGDILIGAATEKEEITILGDATLRRVRGQMDPETAAEFTFWRNGKYYTTMLLRPQAEKAE